MQIICPDCQFAREVDETKIPARSQVATCPKCKTKFQFRELPPEEPQETEQESTAASESDPSKPSQPAQGTLPFGNMPKISTAPAPEDISAGDETKDEGPVFPHLAAPGEDTKKVQHPSGEIWDKLNDMAPPQTRTEDDHPSAAPQQTPPTEKPSGPEQYQQPVPGWTGEFNDDFPDPMGDELIEEDDEGHSPLVPPPFEQLDRYGFFLGIWMTIKLILTSPRLFFSVMPVGGGFSKPLTFTILLTMIQSFVQYFWETVGLTAPMADQSGGEIAGAAGGLAPIFMLLLMPAIIAVGQFAMTGFYHMLLMIMRAGNKGFEGTFRALAYANAPIIIGLFPMPFMEIHIGWTVMVALWGLFLTAVGLKHIHKTSFAKVIPVTIIPLLLAMIAAVVVIQAGMATI